MKIKSIVAAFAVLAMTGIANAASVDWSSAALSFGGTALKKDAGVRGYLVYLAGGALASSYTIDDSFSAATVGTVVSTDSDGTNKGSALTGSLQFTNEYGNGDVFALVMSYSSEGTTYWNVSSTTFALSGVDPTDPTVSPAEWGTFAAASTIVGKTGTLTAGSGWTAAAAVPEPGIACMALLGIGMLIKRRRA